jgi:NADPH:quinone reductase-like Zn-dependent oxidoreductase
MCGRYRLSRRKQPVEEYFDSVGEDDWTPRYNVAPTQPVPIIRQNPKEPRRELSLVRWGLIPWWAKDQSGSAMMINARSETAATKPAFRDALKLRRCLVLHEYGGPEKLKFEDNLPEPQISGGMVLISAAAASVNPIDWKMRSGMRQKDFPLSFPAILGRDVSGVVRAVGANVKHFKPGDRVLALSNATYAELVAVDDSDVTHLPDGVDLADAAAIPLIALTGEQLVRLATNVQKGQVVLVTGALGSVGRAAVHTATKIGAQVIAGVRGKELDDARSLGVSDVLAIDDDEAIEKFRLVDAIADTVGGEVAAKLIAKVKQSGSFGYTAVLPESATAQNPSVKISRVLAQPDPSRVREFADDVRDGKFVLPIGRRMPLRDAAEAHVLGEKGGIGKILLLAPNSQD